jgi:hypothetical protein
MNGQVVPPVYVTPIGSVTPNFPNNAGPVKFAHATPAPLDPRSGYPSGAALGGLAKQKSAAKSGRPMNPGQRMGAAQGVTGKNGYTC